MNTTLLPIVGAGLAGDGSMFGKKGIAGKAGFYVGAFAAKAAPTISTGPCGSGLGREAFWMACSRT